MTRSILAFIGVMAIVPVASAQRGPLFSGGFIAGIPQGGFDRHLSGPAFGMNFFFGDRVPQVPLVVGIDAGILIYGLETRDWPFEPYVGRTDAFTTRGIGMAHFVLRLQDVEQSVSPYADVLIGAKYLFTDTRLDGGGWDYAGDPYPDSPAFDDVAFSYGMGGGVRMQWHFAERDHGGYSGRVTLHAGVRYLFGGPARYLTRDSAAFDEDGEVIHRVHRSRTDLIVPEFGLSLSL